MNRFFNGLFLKIILGLKLLATLLMLIFPMLFTVLFPFSTGLPFVVGAMAYGDIQKWLLIAAVFLAVVSTLCLIVFSIVAILKHKWCMKFAYILIACYLLELIGYITTLAFGGGLLFGKIFAIAFNGMVVGCLWNQKRQTSAV